MIRLPSLTTDRLDWHLPLSALGTSDLLRCLLIDDLEQARSESAELLSVEPALLLWCICRSPHWRSASPLGLQDVANWLVSHGLAVLDWQDHDRAALALCEPAQLRHWAELACQSIVASRLASGGRDGGSLQLTLLGSLHNAADWLASAGPAVDVSATADQPGCLPEWLVEWLRDLAAQPPADPRAAAVAQAVGALRAATNQDACGSVAAEAGDFSADECMRGVRERWLASHDVFGNLLPDVIRKLAKWRELEDHFDRALEKEKLEALKGFAYGASHEINNPLANISTRAQTLLREETDPERRRKWAVINSQAFRAHELIADLMLFARPPALSVAPVDLVGLADQVVSELAAEAAAQRTALVRLPQPSPVIVSADGGHLAAALKALCVNSLEALRLGGRIEISVQVSTLAGEDADGAKWAEVAVADTGPGIPPEVMRHLFAPYFSGREAGRGIGLGLSKTWRIVTEHGGRIDVDSQVEHGATFRIRLPVPQAG